MAGVPEQPSMELGPLKWYNYFPDAAARAGTWVAGIALIVAVAVVAGLGSEAPSVGWVVLELPILAAWLALGARVNRMLSTPTVR
jgi:hypothetical protein